jgi:hypothetical protein
MDVWDVTGVRSLAFVGNFAFVRDFAFIGNRFVIEWHGPFVTGDGAGIDNTERGFGTGIDGYLSFVFRFTACTNAKATGE